MECNGRVRAIEAGCPAGYSGPTVTRRDILVSRSLPQVDLLRLTILPPRLRTGLANDSDSVASPAARAADVSYPVRPPIQRSDSSVQRFHRRHVYNPRLLDYFERVPQFMRDECEQPIVASTVLVWRHAMIRK